MTSASTVSVVICVRNQAARLRLVLRGLSVQSLAPGEILVVDDESTDGISSLLEEACTWFAPGVLRAIRNAPRLGAAASRNAGARAARGDLLLFLDADALPTSRHVEAHEAAHRVESDAIVIGPLWHTTTTEYLRDPTTGALFDVTLPDAVATKLEADKASMLITEDDVVHRFEGIVARSNPGTYPHLGYLESEGERIHDRCHRHAAAWLLMTPQNVSLKRAAFEAVSGFDESLPFCEGWDLLLSLLAKSFRVVRVREAPIYHLYHHHSFGEFRETVRRWHAITLISQKHHRRALLLCMFAFHFRAGDPMLPEDAGPRDLDHVAELLARFPGDDLGPYELLLRGHPLLAEVNEAIAAQSREAQRK